MAIICYVIMRISEYSRQVMKLFLQLQSEIVLFGIMVLIVNCLQHSKNI